MKNIIKSCNQIDEASKATFETGQLSESNIDKLKRVVVDYFLVHLPTARQRTLTNAHTIAVNEIRSKPDRMARQRILSQWYTLVLRDHRERQALDD